MGVRIGAQQQSAAIQDLETKVQALTEPGPAFTDPISKFSLAQGSSAGRVQITFRVARTPGVDSVQVYRGLTRDFGSAQQLNQYAAGNIQPNTDIAYADVSTSIAGKKVWYWLQIVPSNKNNGTIEHGPQSIVAP